MFYPGNANSLRNEVEHYVTASERKSGKPVKFIISPHAGYAYSGKIAGDSFAEAIDGPYDHVMLLGPSHRHYFADMAESGESYWDIPTGSVPILHTGSTDIVKNSRYHQSEHCLEVQVPFIHHVLPDVPVTPVLISGPHENAKRFADVLSQLDTEKTLWVISSDLNHVGPSFQHFPESHGFASGEAMDMQAIDYITSGDIKGLESFLHSTRATICGVLPILVAMLMIKKQGRAEFTFKTYDCSGNQTGDSNSVGYASLYS